MSAAMSRILTQLAALVLATAAPAACGGREPAPVAPSDEPPPLPPASGTHVGYLLDNAGQLELTATQVDELKRIDASLAATNDSIDTQLREIERPEELPPPEKGQPPPKVNMAPGAMPMTTSADAHKLHEARKANNAEALARAFALLEPAQQDKARALLGARGIAAPKAVPAASAGPAASPP